MSEDTAKNETLRSLGIKAREKRTAWLESYGVPISAEFAEFAEAIGTLIQVAESSPIEERPTAQSEAEKVEKAYFLGRAAGFEFAALEATEWYGKRGDALDIARAIRDRAAKFGVADPVAPQEQTQKGKI